MHIQMRNQPLWISRDSLRFFVNCKKASHLIDSMTDSAELRSRWYRHKPLIPAASLAKDLPSPERAECFFYRAESESRSSDERGYWKKGIVLFIPLSDSSYSRPEGNEYRNRLPDCAIKKGVLLIEEMLTAGFLACFDSIGWRGGKA